MTATPAPSSSPSTWMRWRRPLAITAGIAALWTAVIGAWLPGFIRPRIEAAAMQALGTPVALQQVHIHPWTWVVAVDGLSVGPQATPMLTLAHAEVQLSLESLWRLAPVLRRVSVLKPELWVERQSAQRFNFSPVLEHLMAQARPSKADDEPARFAIFNIELKDGLIRYTDRVLNQEHRVEQLQVGVPFVSSLASFVDVEVHPLLSARIDGSPLLIKGETLPFKDGLRSEVKVNLDAVDVPHWLAAAQPLMPPGLHMEAASGQLDTALTLQFEARKPPAVPRLAIRGGLKLRKLDLAMPRAPGLGQVQAGWDQLAIEGIDTLPLEREVKIAAVQLDGLRWQSQPAGAVGPNAAAASGAAANASRSATASPTTAPASPRQAPAGASVPSQPWQWQLGQLRIATGRIDVQTQANAGTGKGHATRWPAIASLKASASGLNASAKAKPAAWQFELHDEHDASLQARGHAEVARLKGDAILHLSGAQLGPWLAPLQQLVAMPLKIDQGRLAIDAQLEARLKSESALAPAQARLVGGRVRIEQLAATATSPGSRDRIELATVTLDGIEAQLDLGDKPGLHHASANALELVKLDAALTRGAHGEWLGMAPPVSAKASADAPSTAAGKAPSSTDKAAQPLPPITLKTLHCEACQAHVKDMTVSPAAEFNLSEMALLLSDLSSDLGHVFKIDLSTLAQGQGRVQFKGDVRPEPLSVAAHIGVAGLDLRAVQPYIDPLVNIRLANGRAQADGQLKLQMPAQGGLQVRYQGRAGLSDLRVQDRVNEADFVSWQALTLDGVDIALADQALDANLGRIALKDFYGRVIVNPDGQLNLAGILRHEAGGDARSLTTPEPGAMPANAAGAAPAGSTTASVAATASAASAPSTASGPSPKLRWQQIVLSKGRVDFTDHFIKPNYSARLTQIEGDISAVASTKPEPATIKVSGAVDDAAPLQITGQIHPLGPQLYTDIQGTAKGIELNRLSPYAGHYAGYAIDKGTLSVTVHYKINGGKLEASNQIFLDQLAFGDKVDSPDATTLPVRLAVSLLKNSKGEIDINLPISGSIDDPQFSVGGILWHVLLNLISKAVTAPFALLSGGSDELGFVPFAPGSAELGDATRLRLDTLALKLNDRPALKLEATGHADPVVDEAGLRQAHVDALMRQAKAKATGQSLEEVQMAADERPTWLAAAYKAADIKKPRNLVGLAKTLPPAEMEALLRASAPVGPAELLALANQRGDQVKAYLAGKMPPERVLLTASKVGKEGLPEDKGPSSRVQFAIK